MENLHQVNIYIHIVTGTIAMLLGVVAFISKKGGTLHNKNGKWYLGTMFIVILTSLFGVFIFQRNIFLLVVTALSGYAAFSGYRCLQTKSNVPNFIDVSAALLTISTAIYFLYYLDKIGLVWSASVTISLTITLFLLIAYDFIRYLIPRNKAKKLWFYEHIFKMTISFNALTSAFSATVFEAYKPYSQFVPAIIGSLIGIAFMRYYYLKNKTIYLPEVS